MVQVAGAWRRFPPAEKDVMAYFSAFAACWRVLAPPLRVVRHQAPKAKLKFLDLLGFLVHGHGVEMRAVDGVVAR